MKNPNCAGCNVIETMRVLKFPQLQGSLQLARKVSLDQVAYKNEARGLKSVKMQTFSRCNEGTIVDGSVKNSNCKGCNVIESTEIFASSRLTSARKKGCTIDQVEYENEARGVKSLKIQAIRRCNKGTIVDGRVKNPNRTGMNACNRNFRKFMAHCSSQERLY